MSMFDNPGSLEAIQEWIDARKARNEASDAYEEARIKAWNALVRMARANKRVVEIVGPEHADHFRWMASLYGDRDQIIKTADKEASA